MFGSFYRILQIIDLFWRVTPCHLPKYTWSLPKILQS